MEFLYNAGDWVIFGNSLPFKQIKEILNYSDDVESDNVFTLTKEFRVSYNYNSWSTWSTLNEANLNNVITLEFYKFGNLDIDDNWNADEVWGISFTNGEKWKIKQDSPSPFKIVFSDGITYEKGEILNAGFFTVLNGLRTIEEISYFDTNKPKDFWIQYKYTLATGSNVSINFVELEVEENIINPYSCKKILKPIDSGCGSPLLIDTECDESFAFNDQNNLLKNLFIELNTMVSSIAGLTVEWFKFNPVANSEDVLFHEWTLYEVEAPKYINIVVPGGKMPDSKPLYNPYDIDFEMPFEIHISKKTWESIYGLTIPQKRDIVWIPQTNKVWEVASSYLQREFSNIGVYYKVFLTKYQPRNNAIKSAEVDQMLDEKILSQEEAFNELLNTEIEKIQKPELNTDDNIFDDMRKEINAGIINSKILNFFTTVAKQHYDIGANIDYTYEESKQDSFVPHPAIIYNAPNLWNKSENRSFSCWFQIQKPQKRNTTITFVSSGIPIGPRQYTINWDDTPVDFGYVFNIWDDDISFIATVVAIYSNILVIELSEYWFTYLDAIDLTPYFTTGLNWSTYIENNLIQNHNGSKGMIINVEYAQYLSLLKIKLNTVTYNVPLDMADDLSDGWYGLFVNVSNEFGKLESNLYKIQWNIDDNTNRTNKLLKIAGNILDIPAENRTTSLPWTIDKSYLNLTNIRLWNTTCQVELQSKILNQYVPENSDLLIISDIANEPTRLPLL